MPMVLIQKTNESKLSLPQGMINADRDISKADCGLKVVVLMINQT